MNKTKKLLYIPGIISLIGIWCFYFFTKEKFKIKKESYLSLAIPKDGNDYSYTIGAIIKKIATKKQIKIELNGDTEINERKIEIIRYEIRKLQYIKDTTTVLNINLTNETTYGDMVKLIELCYTENAKTFILLKKSFIIFGDQPTAREAVKHYM